MKMQVKIKCMAWVNFCLKSSVDKAKSYIQRRNKFYNRFYNTEEYLEK